jgi:MFS family permease
VSESARVPWHRELNANHWRVLIASFLGWIFDGYENYALFLVMAPALRELLPVEQVTQVSSYSGIIIAAMLLGIGLGGVTAGVVADYLGRKRTMMLTILVYSVCTGLTGFVQSWEQLAFFRFLAGLGMGGEWATGPTLMAESWPPRGRRASASCSRRSAGGR